MPNQAVNRNNPGANLATNVAALPFAVNNPADITAFCVNAACAATQPIGPGTTVGFRSPRSWACG